MTNIIRFAIHPRLSENTFLWEGATSIFWQDSANGINRRIFFIITTHSLLNNLPQWNGDMLRP
jgi:hypothetical protein